MLASTEKAPDLISLAGSVTPNSRLMRFGAIFRAGGKRST
jgi:hypothetical protein